MEKVWLNRYLVHFNAKKAAEEAGYKWPRRVGWQKKQKFADEIAEQLDEMALSAEEALARLSEQAMAEYAQYLTDEGTVNLTKLIDDEKAHLVKGYRRDRKGNVIVEFHDAQRALITILDHHTKGPTGSEDDPLHIKYITENRPDGNGEQSEEDDSTGD